MQSKRNTFVRFVADAVDADSGKRQGVFQAAYALLDGNELPAYEREQLQHDLHCFRDHLRVPTRFAQSRSKAAAPKAIGWFKSSATDAVGRMHAICRVLEEHGVQTHMITTDRPGYVVYEDDQQIAAVPFNDTMT